MSRKKVVMIGCFDTKATDFEYLRSCLAKEDLEVIEINTGVFPTQCPFPVAFDAAEVAKAAGYQLSTLRDKSERSTALDNMAHGASKIIASLVARDQVAGAIGMGGGGGTYLTLLAMQTIPIGIPKLCLSTVASKDLARQVGSKDITLMQSVVDIAGPNQISKMQMRQAAGAIAGMVKTTNITQEKKAASIAISMFGNTTPCVEKCSELLRAAGYEVLAFHAVGVGGQTMEALIRDGYFAGVLDITTTELADHLCDGICSAGPNRLTAAAEMGIPQVVVPGCLDMVNYGHPDTVPEKYRERKLYSWAPDVTLMRTNKIENEQLGLTIAHRLNNATGKVAILLPLRGISKLSGAGEPFYDPETDQVLFKTIKEKTDDFIEIQEINANINDTSFATAAVNILLQLLQDHI
jgi:uncharacterized protein (UPF0261 family)